MHAAARECRELLAIPEMRSDALLAAPGSAGWRVARWRPVEGPRAPLPAGRRSVQQWKTETETDTVSCCVDITQRTSSCA
jgi:hypothetical protein